LTWLEKKEGLGSEALSGKLDYDEPTDFGEPGDCKNSLST
jgi:hypothetical protein